MDTKPRANSSGEAPGWLGAHQRRMARIVELGDILDEQHRPLHASRLTCRTRMPASSTPTRSSEHRADQRVILRAARKEADYGEYI